MMRHCRASPGLIRRVECVVTQAVAHRSAHAGVADGARLYREGAGEKLSRRQVLQRDATGSNARTACRKNRPPQRRALVRRDRIEFRRRSRKTARLLAIWNHLEFWSEREDLN